MILDSSIEWESESDVDFRPQQKQKSYTEAMPGLISFGMIITMSTWRVEKSIHAKHLLVWKGTPIVRETRILGEECINIIILAPDLSATLLFRWILSKHLIILSSNYYTNKARLAICQERI